MQDRNKLAYFLHTYLDNIAKIRINRVQAEAYSVKGGDLCKA